MATFPISQSEDKLMNTLSEKQQEDVHSEGTDEILNDLNSQKNEKNKSKLIPQNGDSENEVDDNEKEISKKELIEALDSKDSDSDQNEKYDEQQQNEPNILEKLIQKYGSREVVRRSLKASAYFGLFIAGVYAIKKIPKVYQKEIKRLQRMYY